MINQFLTRGLLRIGIIYLVLSGLWFIADSIIPGYIIFNHFLVLNSASFLIASLVFGLVSIGLQKPERKRVVFTLGAIGLKFFLFLIVLVVYILVVKDVSWNFLGMFFIIYISYTVYLLITFVKVLKSHNHHRLHDKGQ